MNSNISLPVNSEVRACLLSMLLMVISFHSYSQSCDCPAVDECGECEGGITSLTLEYNASPLDLLAAVITVSDEGGVIFSGTVNDGEEFSFTSSAGNGARFIGDKVTITADILSTVEIFTSCSTPVYIGDTYDNYTVTAGTSESGYAICCSAETMEDVPPEITGCPADITVYLNESECTTEVKWNPPTAIDNCGIADSTNNHNPRDIFEVGTTEVIYTFTDTYGNTAICSFSINVIDEINPVISECPSTIEGAADDSGCEPAVSWVAPTESDNCSAVLTSTHNPGDLFPVGVTEVVYTATDESGNTSTCSFDVIVTDETDPVFTASCPSDILITTDGSCESAVTWTEPVATDNCSTVTITSTHSSGDLFGAGTTTVSYTATDAAGNSTSCSFTVEVKEDVAPIIEECPGNINLNTTPETACGAEADWNEPKVSDNCNVSLTSTHKPGDFFPRGKTTVTYTATDNSGNITTCSFDVIANDNVKPTFSGCPSSDIVIPAGESCETNVTWDDITATDNCESVTITNTHNPGDLFPVGKTKVTYTATDDSGNSSKCSFNVVVTQTTPPVISGCPSGIIAPADDASCEAAVSWPAPTATDNCEKVSLTSTHNPGDTFNIGTTTVTYTATDVSENRSTCSFDVTVTDETSPVISGCPSEDIIIIADNTCEAVVSWAEITATDNCGNAILTSTHNSGDLFPAGTTTVTYTATDSDGNTSTCAFDVVVQDETPPTISGCPEDIIAEVDESGEIRVDWAIPTAEGFCGEVTLTGSHEPGDYFTLGTTEVEYAAIDGPGNTATCRFYVILTYKEIAFDIPKLLTPDGDGVNDEWVLKNIENFKQNKVVIVDRWGSIIFSASGYNNENIIWKGLNRNGGLVPSGTYFFTISVEFASQVVEKRGFIEIIN